MKHLRMRNGYAFLFTVLFVGGVGVAVTGSMMLLGWRSMLNSEAVEHANKAFELASMCAERTLMELYYDNDYAGNVVISEGNGTCEILPIGGSGNESRAICTEGISKDSTRRLEIIVDSILPQIEITSWREVEFFSSCSYGS